MFWNFINPVTIAIANSPLHFVVSRNLIVLHFKGVKTGKPYTIPVSYLEEPRGRLSCVTDRANIWWRNLRHTSHIKIMYKGRLIDARITVEHQNNQVIADELEALCSHSRIDGFFAKVGYQDGKPIRKDVETAATGMTLIKVTIG